MATGHPIFRSGARAAQAALLSDHLVEGSFGKVGCSASFSTSLRSFFVSAEA